MAVEAEGTGGVSLAIQPASGTQKRFALVVLLASAGVFLAAVPFAKVQLQAVFAFIPVYQTALVVNDLITAILLLGQLTLRSSRALLALVSGYVFTAAMATAHLLSFPGVFAPTGLLGAGPQSTAWLYMFWHGGFPLFVLAYALLKPNGHAARPRRRTYWLETVAWIGAALVAAELLTLLATAGQQVLPSIMQGSQYTPLMIFVVGSVWFLSLAAGGLLWWRRPHSVLDLSLLVVMAAWLFDIALSAVLNQGRFDVGFYAGRIYGLVAASVVLLALLVENALLYREQSRRAAQAVGAVSQQAEAFHDMLESLPQPLLIVQDGTVQYANRAFAHLLGYGEPAEALADPGVVQRITHPADREALQVPDAVTSRNAANFQAVRVDGTALWLSNQMEAVDWGGRRALALLPRDITARKEAEDKASRSDVRLIEAMESLPGGFFYLDPELRLQFWNNRLLGLMPELRAVLREGMHYNEMLRVIFPFMVTRQTRADGWVESRLRTAHSQLGPVEQELTGGRWLEIINQPNADGGVMCFQTDITARKRVELERRRSEERYRSVVENSVQGLLIVQKGKNVFCNGAYARMFGYASPSELIGTDAINTVHPDDRHADLQLDSERMRAGTPVLFQRYRGVRKDGSTGWYEQHRSDIEWDGRRAVQWAIVDVTELRQSQEQAELSQLRLVESEAQYRTLFQDHPCAMWVYDPETFRFLAVNEATVRAYGYTQEEFLAMSIRDIRPAGEVARMEARVNDVREDPEGAPSAGIWRHRKKNGDLLEAETFTHNLQFMGRAGRLVMAVDVTERLRAQADLRHSEQRYRALAEDSLQGLMTVQRGQVVFANRAVAGMFGYETPEEMLGMEAITLVHPEDRHQALHVGSMEMRSGDPKLYRYYRGVRKDGAKLWYEAHRSDVEWLGHHAIQWVLIDVTQEFHLQQQLESSQRMEAVGRLAGGIAHDFNNILTVISAHAEFLIDDAAPGSKSKDDAQVVQDASRRAAALTRQLLAFSRRQILHMRVLNLSDEVESMRKILSRMIGEDIRLESALAKNIRPIRADVTQIEQVLMNLVVNARDAMPHGGTITVETSNQHLDENYSRSHLEVRPGDYVMMAVTDTGTGMDAETQRRMFEPFFTTKPEGRGTGLGLATVYGIVKQMTGSIYVYSEPGKGTTFKLYFPVAMDIKMENEVSAAAVTAPRPSETILLVEDDELVRRSAQRILTGAGYQVITATNPGDAIATIRQRPEPIHLLFSDVVMPGMSGSELWAAVRKEREVPVLFMSGYTDDAIVRHGILEGDLPFLAKPFSKQSLLEKVREALHPAP